MPFSGRTSLHVRHPLGLHSLGITGTRVVISVGANQPCGYCICSSVSHHEQDIEFCGHVVGSGIRLDHTTWTLSLPCIV